MVPAQSEQTTMGTAASRQTPEQHGRSAGGTFSRRNPEGDGEHEIGRTEHFPCSDRVETSRLRIFGELGVPLLGERRSYLLGKSLLSKVET
jgi:hypothetical protein